MPIQISSKIEDLVVKEIESGRFSSIDEIIQQGIRTRKVDGATSRMKHHREAIVRTRQFIENPIQVQGVTLQELIDEGRSL